MAPCQKGEYLFAGVCPEKSCKGGVCGCVLAREQCPGDIILPVMNCAVYWVRNLIVFCNPVSTFIQGFLHFLVMQSFQTQCVTMCAAVHLGLEFSKYSSGPIPAASWLSCFLATLGLAFGACHSSFWLEWEQKPKSCDANPKPTSCHGHLLVWCKGSMDGLADRMVGVAQRREISGPAVPEGVLMGHKSFLLQWWDGYVICWWWEQCDQGLLYSMAEGSELLECKAVGFGTG